MNLNLKEKWVKISKKIVQWQIKNLRDEKIRVNIVKSEDINDTIIKEFQNIKERWQNLKE